MCLQLVTGPPSRRQFYLQRLDRRQQRRLDRRKRKRCRTRHQTHPESGRVARAASINFNPPGNTSRREQRRRKTSRTRPRRLTTECSRRCTPNRRTGKNEACKPDRQQPPPRKGRQCLRRRREGASPLLERFELRVIPRRHDGRRARGRRQPREQTVGPAKKI